MVAPPEEEPDPELELEPAPLEELAEEPPPHAASRTVRARVAPHDSRRCRARPGCVRVVKIGPKKLQMLSV
jgi:hypothetical protein